MTDRKAQSAGKHLSILQIAIVDDDAGVRRTLTETIDLLPDTEGLRPPLRVRMLGRLAPNALTVAKATLGHPVRRGR